jgi:hypothetical protein
MTQNAKYPRISFGSCFVSVSHTFGADSADSADGGVLKNHTPNFWTQIERFHFSRHPHLRCLRCLRSLPVFERKKSLP